MDLSNDLLSRDFINDLLSRELLVFGGLRFSDLKLPVMLGYLGFG